MALEEDLDPGLHFSSKTNFVCLMCQSPKMEYDVHGTDGDFASISYECSECHDFIRYLEADNTPYKDEYHFEDFYVIDEGGHIYFNKNGDFLDSQVAFPKFEITSKDQLFSKIKTYLTFL